MPLDPEFEKIIKALERPESERPTQLTAEYMRANQIPSSVGFGRKVARTTDRSIPGPELPIPVRTYEPEGTGPFPILVYCHGGGWTTCGLDTHDALCRALTNASGCVVVSVDYRLAPEHKFPAGFDDAFAVAAYVATHASEFNGNGRMAVGGDSAGANLSAAVALRARDEGGPQVDFQLLAYPMVDDDFTRPSFRDNADGYLLTADTVRWFWEQYLRTPADGKNPYASPLLAETLRGLPPAMIITAEFDPLRDDGSAYAAALSGAGVPVEHRDYEGMIHIHWMALQHPIGATTMRDAGQALRKALGS